MSAASAAAAVESVKDNSSSELFLNGFDQKALKRIIPNERSYSVMNDRHYRWGTDMGQHTYSSTHFSSQESKPFLVTPNQSMFLTKNAHIKRPRNAWIRVRKYAILRNKYIFMVTNFFFFFFWFLNINSFAVIMVKL
jgi:hypothetical protein